MSNIIPGKLYLGNVLNVNRLSWLDQHNIQTIVCVASPRDVVIRDEISARKTVHQFDILDNEDQILAFDPIVQLIESSMEKGAVLVNCAVGISRSASFVIAYLMKTQQLSLDMAFARVKQARPKIQPNPSFVTQLVAYERKIRTYSSGKPTESVPCVEGQPPSGAIALHCEAVQKLSYLK